MNETLPPHPVSHRAELDALARFLENHGDDFLSWQDGYVVVETYRDKQFRALGGDTNRLITFFEDYGNMTDAALNYIEAMWNASRDLVCYRCDGNGVTLDHTYIPPSYTNCKSCDGTGHFRATPAAAERLSSAKDARRSA